MTKVTELEKQEQRGLDVLAQRINDEHRACEAAANTAVDHAIRAGEMLVEVKEKSRHGEWIPWLEQNFVGGVRTAQSYMKLYSRRDELAEMRNGVAHLPMREALRAIAKPMPELEPSPQQRYPGLALYTEFCEGDEAFVENWVQAYKKMSKEERLYFERESAFNVHSEAVSYYAKHVREARERLIAHIDVVTTFNENPAIVGMRERVTKNNWDETRLTPEEGSLVESLYPDLHSEIRKMERFVLAAEHTQFEIEQTLRPMDIKISREYFDLEKKLTSEQMHTPFAELVDSEVLCPKPDPFAAHTTIRRALRALDDGLVELPRDADGFYTAIDIASRAGWSEDELREMLPLFAEWANKD